MSRIRENAHACQKAFAVLILHKSRAHRTHVAVRSLLLLLSPFIRLGPPAETREKFLVPVDMDASKIPLMVNPSGGPPNFEDPPSLLDAQLGIGITLIAIGAVLVTFRVVTNLKVSRKLCFDDSKRSPLLMRYPPLPY
jgi:hypothetical protein